ncbi:MAG: ribonuclease HII [Bacteroidia bacterium]|nr:ribonuclease HII [Bacteroidia bacterium]MDW8088451.1 ribonuclease HII [Bacteroidia bacterium]
MWVAGVDEAGRGSLAGPVVAAAVILPPIALPPIIRDSKALTPVQRTRAFAWILQRAEAIGIGMQSAATIDQVGILRATLWAMEEALDTLPLTPARIRIDGPHAPKVCRSMETHIRGDSRFPEIAAASIVAKVVRDGLMRVIDGDFPMYGWKRNKGYPTRQHWEALARYGPCVHHRQSFLRQKAP